MTNAELSKFYGVCMDPHIPFRVKDPIAKNDKCCFLQLFSNWDSNEYGNSHLF